MDVHRAGGRRGRWCAAVDGVERRQGFGREAVPLCAGGEARRLRVAGGEPRRRGGGEPHSGWRPSGA